MNDFEKIATISNLINIRSFLFTIISRSNLDSASHKRLTQKLQILEKQLMRAIGNMEFPVEIFGTAENKNDQE
jgi:hypothetical protein